MRIVAADADQFEDDIERNVFRSKHRITFPRCPQPLALDGEVENIPGADSLAIHRSADNSELPLRAKARAAADLLDFNDKISKQANSTLKNSEGSSHFLDKDIGHLRLRRKLEQSVRKLLAARPAPAKLQHDLWGGGRNRR